MLDEYSEVRPRALNTRLSLEPEYFCSLIELFYKKRNGEKREIELNKSLSDRLCEILFQFKVTPGIDWNGNFDAKRFDYWMNPMCTSLINCAQVITATQFIILYSVKFFNNCRLRKLVLI